MQNLYVVVAYIAAITVSFSLSARRARFLWRYGSVYSRTCCNCDKSPSQRKTLYKYSFIIYASCISQIAPTWILHQTSRASYRTFRFNRNVIALDIKYRQRDAASRILAPRRAGMERDRERSRVNTHQANFLNVAPQDLFYCPRICYIRIYHKVSPNGARQLSQCRFLNFDASRLTPCLIRGVARRSRRCHLLDIALTSESPEISEYRASATLLRVIDTIDQAHIGLLVVVERLPHVHVESVSLDFRRRSWHG